MGKKQPSWIEEFEKLTNRGGFSDYECTNWKVGGESGMYAKTIIEFTGKLLEQAREDQKKKDAEIARKYKVTLKSGYDKLTVMWNKIADLNNNTCDDIAKDILNKEEEDV
jgi:hypothetical protein